MKLLSRGPKRRPMRSKIPVALLDHAEQLGLEVQRQLADLVGKKDSGILSQGGDISPVVPGRGNISPLFIILPPVDEFPEVSVSE